MRFFYKSGEVRNIKTLCHWWKVISGVQMFPSDCYIVLQPHTMCAPPHYW